MSLDDDAQMDWLRWQLGPGAGVIDRDTFFEVWKTGAAHRDAGREIERLKRDLELEKDRYDHDTQVLADAAQAIREQAERNAQIDEMVHAMKEWDTGARVQKRDELVEEIAEWNRRHVTGFGNAHQRTLGQILADYYAIRAGEEETEDD